MPFPGPQTAALETEADELFFGGSAGGGKSYLLLGLGATRHRATIIFRRELTQIRELEDKSRVILDPTGARLNQQLHLWRDIPGKRTLEFGGLKDHDDYKKYYGRPHDLKAYDEITSFTKEQYVITKAWNRTDILGQRCRVVCTGNPPLDAEGQWVIDYWGPWLNPSHPNPAQPGELRWFAQVGDDEVECPDGSPIALPNGRVIRPRSRTFIPARVEDNPVYMATGYDSVLDSLPEPLRSMLRDGNFHATHKDDPWQVIPTAWVLAAQQRWQEMERPAVALRSVGVDVARGGKDKTAIARLWGTYFDRLSLFPGADTPDGPTVARYVTESAPADAHIFVDVIGVGSSPFDILRSVWNYEAVYGVNNGSHTDALDKSGKFGFANVRAESYWKLREALDPSSGENIALPPDRELLADLCAAKFKVVGGKYQVEPKDDIKKRIGRSPDCGDAVVLAYYGAVHSSGAIGFVPNSPVMPTFSDEEARLQAETNAYYRRLMGSDD